MRRGTLYFGAAVIVLGGLLAWTLLKNDKAKPEIRTSQVVRGNVVQSVTATGVLQCIQTVDVKSKAGGIVETLAVDVGSEVKKGDLIARIEKTDTAARHATAKADFQASKARVEQAKNNAALQEITEIVTQEQAEANLRQAKARLRQAEEQARIQPELTRTSIETAKANLDSAEEALRQMESAGIPQKRANVRSAFERAETNLQLAQRELERQQDLYDRGYISRSQFDAQRNRLDLAKAEHKSAKQSLDNLDRDIANDLKAAQTRLATAKAGYDAALANRIQDEIRAQELESAKAAVRTAEAQLKQARNAHLTTLVRKADITTAMSGVASSQAQLDNARKLMDQTVITAPNDGVILKKYVEEGAIITSGVSSVAQGTNIVQIGNTNTMIVNTAVDETDIAGIEEGMRVDVTVDAYPSSPFEGRVRRISPEAVAVQNVTTINVEVEILDVDPRLKPGLNATCEFIIERRTDVLLVPNEAVKEKEDGSSYVTVLEGEKQIDKKVVVGLQGNSDTEIKSGLKEGEYVITAIIEPQQEQARNPGGGVGMFGGGMRGASRQMGGR